MDKIRSLADLRPGDLMFGPIGGIVPGLFPVGIGQAMLMQTFRAGRMSVRHVGVVVERADITLIPGPQPKIRKGPRLVQAMPRGAEEIVLTQATHWTDRHAYVRLPEDYPGQAADAAAIARLFVTEKVPYSFASYLALVAWRWGIKTPRLEKWINRRRPAGWHEGFQSRKTGDRASVNLPCEAICSVLADQAWTLAGKRVMEATAPQAVTPGALATRVFSMEGIVWGGKGFLR